MQWEKGVSAWKQISDDIETSIKTKLGNPATSFQRKWNWLKRISE